MHFLDRGSNDAWICVPVKYHIRLIPHWIGSSTGARKGLLSVWGPSEKRVDDLYISHFALDRVRLKFFEKQMSSPDRSLSEYIFFGADVCS